MQFSGSRKQILNCNIACPYRFKRAEMRKNRALSASHRCEAITSVNQNKNVSNQSYLIDTLPSAIEKFRK